MLERMQRATKKDIEFYEEVEHNPSYDDEAFKVVLLVAVAGGLGLFLAGITSLGGSAALSQGIVHAIQLLVTYYVWSFLVLIVGTKMFAGTSDLGEVRRTIGYSYSPNVAQVLIFVPVLGPLISLVAGIWSIVLGIVAVRQAMDFSTGNAVVTVVIAALLALIVGALLRFVAFLLLAAVGVAGLM